MKEKAARRQWRRNSNQSMAVRMYQLISMKICVNVKKIEEAEMKEKIMKERSLSAEISKM